MIVPMIPIGEVQVRIGERATDRAEHHVVRGDSEVDVLDEGDLEAGRVGVRVGVGVGVRVRVRVRDRVRVRVRVRASVRVQARVRVRVS